MLRMVAIFAGGKGAMVTTYLCLATHRPDACMSHIVWSGLMSATTDRLWAALRVEKQVHAAVSKYLPTVLQKRP